MIYEESYIQSLYDNEIDEMIKEYEEIISYLRGIKKEREVMQREEKIAKLVDNCIGKIFRVNGGCDYIKFEERGIDFRFRDFDQILKKEIDENLSFEDFRERCNKATTLKHNTNLSTIAPDALSRESIENFIDQNLTMRNFVYRVDRFIDHEFIPYWNMRVQYDESTDTKSLDIKKHKNLYKIEKGVFKPFGGDIKYIEESTGLEFSSRDMELLLVALKERG